MIASDTRKYTTQQSGHIGRSVARSFPFFKLGASHPDEIALQTFDTFGPNF